ncbi:MAG: type 1 glutamine amidotransferase domain-containing protein [Candidatus Woesebacteria bacterium]|jgi:protease I
MRKQKQKKAVIIIGPGFEDSEFIYPYYRLLEAGLRVDIAAKEAATTIGKHGWPVQATIDTANLDAKNYDLVLIPGGYEGPDRVRQIKEVLTFIAQMHKKGKIICSVCHGIWVLISAGIMKGKKATCYHGCKDDLKNAGAKYFEKAVVRDKNIITSPHFNVMHLWMKTVIKAIK